MEKIVVAAAVIAGTGSANTFEYAVPRDAVLRWVDISMWGFLPTPAVAGGSYAQLLWLATNTAASALSSTNVSTVNRNFAALSIYPQINTANPNILLGASKFLPEVNIPLSRFSKVTARMSCGADIYGEAHLAFGIDLM